MTYELHPLCILFPRMTGDEFDALVKDIATNGLRQPIVMFEGMILDGGNRYHACIEAEVEPTFVEYDDGDPATYVLSANLHRRHLLPGQHAAIVASVQNWAMAQGRGGDRKSDQTARLPFDSVADRAAMSGASERTQRMADKVAKSDPELAKEVARGEKTLPEAIEQITGKRPGARQPAKKTEVLAGEPPYDPTQDRIAELAHTVTELAQENDRLKDAIAVGNMDSSLIDGVDALETLATLRQRVIDLEREVETLRGSRDDYQMRVAELKRQCAMQRREIEKLKKFAGL